MDLLTISNNKDIFEIELDNKKIETFINDNKNISKQLTNNNEEKNENKICIGNEAKNEELKEKISKIEILENEIKLNNEKFKKREEEYIDKNYEKKVQIIEKENNILKEEIIKIKKKLNEKIDENQNLINKLNTSKINDYNLGIINLDLKNKIAQKENELVDLKYELVQNKNQLNNLEKELDNKRKVINNLIKENKKIEKECKDKIKEYEKKFIKEEKKGEIIELKQFNENNTKIINVLNKTIKQKDSEIDRLKKEMIDLKNNLINKSDMMCVHFSSSNGEINYSIPCVNSDIFEEIERKLYKEYPKYRETNNIFLYNGSSINRLKTIEENKIKSGELILLNVFE